MNRPTASDSLLSEASSTDQELSFSASASRSGNGKAAPRVALPSWPATRVSPAGRMAKNVSFNDRSESAELSFTAASPSKRSIDVDPVHVVEQQHEVDMERMHRHHIRDEESTVRQHIVRSVAIDKIRLQGESQLRQAKLKESTPIDNTNAQVTPVMVKYMNHLKNAPKDDGCDKLRQERQKLSKQVSEHRRTGEALREEAMLRKKYMDDVKQTVEQQEAEASDEMHQKRAKSTQRQKELVTAASASKAQHMDQNAAERLRKLQYRHAYVKLHGDYEHRVVAADEQRLTRLAQVSHKVVSHHSPNENADADHLRRRVAESAAARRAKAEELARRQHELLTQRIQERQDLVRSEHDQATQLVDEELAAQRAARLLLKEGDEALQRVERERERAIFLNRMSCNAEFNVELERLRQQRRQEEHALWDEKHQANAERLSAANVASMGDKQNKGKLQVIDRLMIEEAVVIDKATRRLENKRKAQSGQEQRLLLMEAEDFNKMKVLEDLYGQRRNTVLPAIPSVIKDREQIQWSENDHHEHSAARSRSNEDQKSVLRAREIADEEERLRKQYIATHYPRLRRVVSPRNKVLPRSLAFAPKNVLRKPNTNNPRLLELTAHLFQLEQDKAPSVNPASPLSMEERCASRLRLTQRDAAQEALRLAYDDQERLPTIHDNVQKQKAPNARLYQSRQNSAVPRHVNDDDSFTLDDDSNRIKEFVARFYTEPLRRHEQSLASAVAKVTAQLGKEQPLRMTDKELTNVQERLYYSDTRHLSPALERKIDEREQQRTAKTSNLCDQEAVERFYTTPLEAQRVLSSALDDQYLK